MVLVLEDLPRRFVTYDMNALEIGVLPSFFLSFLLSLLPCFLASFLSYLLTYFVETPAVMSETPVMMSMRSLSVSPRPLSWRGGRTCGLGSGRLRLLEEKTCSDVQGAEETPKKPGDDVDDVIVAAPRVTH